MKHNDRSDCPSDEELSCFLQGEAASSLMARVEVHLDVCDPCRQVVSVCAATSERTPRLRGHGNAVVIQHRRFPDEFLIGDRYKVVELLGRGGMGYVYRVFDLLLNQVVALKILHKGDGDHDSLERIRTEVQLARRVTHPHVCRIFDVGVHREADDQTTFLTMEFIDGETLAERMRRGDLSFGFVKRIARQVAEGLACAHDSGIIHRDIKPQNVILRGAAGSSQEQAVVTDFGLASRVQGSRSGQSIGSVRPPCGTLGYMAPELWQGRAATPAVDLYSFGIMLRNLLHGDDVPSEDGPASKVPSGSGEHADRLELNRLIDICTRSNPDERPANFHSVLGSLEKIGRDIREGRRRASVSSRMSSITILMGIVILAVGGVVVRRRHGAVAGLGRAEASAAAFREGEALTGSHPAKQASPPILPGSTPGRPICDAQAVESSGHQQASDPSIIRTRRIRMTGANRKAVEPARQTPGASVPSHFGDGAKPDESRTSRAIPIQDIGPDDAIDAFAPEP